MTRPQENVYPALLQIGSDSEDSDYSESGSIHEAVTGEEIIQSYQPGPINIPAPVITALALTPNQNFDENQNVHNHSYATNPFSTHSLPSSQVL